MNEHTVDLNTALGPVTAEFSNGQLTGYPVALGEYRAGVRGQLPPVLRIGLPAQSRLDRSLRSPGA